MSSNNSNQEIAKKLQAFLKESGYEVKLGHAYEVLSKLAGHASYNVASAKNVDLSKVFVDVAPVDVDPVGAPRGTLPTFEVKVKFGNVSKGEIEIKKYYRVSATDEVEAKDIINEYLSFRCQEIDLEDIKHPQTRLLMEIESEREFETEDWEVTSLPTSFPFIEEVYSYGRKTLAGPVLKELERRKAAKEEREYGDLVRKELAKSTIPIQRTRRGKTVLDVSECPMTNDGDYFLTDFQENIDYCVGDPNTLNSKNIVTIGRHKKSGEIFASTTDRYYENPDFECLFLR